MMEVARIRDGVMDYASTHMMPKMDSKGQFVLGLGLGVIASRIDAIVGKLSDNELVKTLGIIQNGQCAHHQIQLRRARYARLAHQARHGSP